MTHSGSKPTSSTTSAFWSDALASVVVFLVALPLCMGISIASGAPASAGLLSGIVGGIIVGTLAGCPLQVSGPAAGLSVIVFEIVSRHGLPTLGVICALAGVLQLAAGILRIGQWFRAVPPPVIHGMLAGIGILIFAGQFHVMVDDKPLASGLANLMGIPSAVAKGILALDGSSHNLAAMTGLTTLAVLVLWGALAPQSLRFVPAPLVAVASGTLGAWILELPIAYVAVPDSLTAGIRLPDAELLDKLWQPAVWGAALAIAIIASAETLLTSVAVDAMQQRAPRTGYDRELLAQGAGNLVSGLIGGLPITGVIVRSKANVDAGATSRRSAVLHGFWILAVVAAFPGLLGKIPVASLAAILVFTGYKLVNPEHIRAMAAHGRSELAIYLLTVGAIVCTDLLKGVLFGLALGAVKLLYIFSHVGIHVDESRAPSEIHIHVEGFATFLVLPVLALDLERVPPGATVHVHTQQVDYVDHACLDLLRTWQVQHQSTGGHVHVNWERLRELFHNGGRWRLEGARWMVAQEQPSPLEARAEAVAK
ncbi:MAG: SulP family inorganic anion transporter [Candidatus Wallbacteria bacterium]|nr:SulP family inorganic anion transporter [Candidatus Wallbacteria bacterium]